MNDDQPSAMDKAATIIGELLIPMAVEGIDPLCEAIDMLSDAQVQACLVFAVYFDRLQQRDQRVAYSIDVAALDALKTAAETSVAEVRDVALELPIETACEALGELVFLHREIKATEAIARTAAQFN